MNYEDFQAKCQQLVREQGRIARDRYLARLKANGWYTIKDVPPEQRVAFADYVENGDASEQAVS